MASIRLVVYGASGRLGSRICRMAASLSGVELVGAVAHPGSSALGAPAAPHAHDASKSPIIVGKSGVSCDVVIDASTPEGTCCAARHASLVSAALVVCTTGLDDAALAEISLLCARSAVLVAPNTSIGVAALRLAIGALGGASGSLAGVGVVDIHRAGKRDAPSGTALQLAGDLRDAGFSVSSSDIVSLRVGDAVGEHTVRFELGGECLEFTHRVRDIDVFARGALHGAKWLVRQPAGKYAMSDVLRKNA